MYDDFQEIELKYYCFINLEKFNLLNTDEKYNFLIKNKILINTGNTTPSFSCVYDSVPFIYSKNEFYFDDLYDFKGYNYDININVKEEFYNYLKVRIEELYTDPYTTIEGFKFKIEFLDRESKLKFLKKKYKKNFKILNKELSFKLYVDEIYEYNGFNSWKELVMHLFNNDLFQYLTSTKYTHSEVIVTWCNLFVAKTIMNYCKNQIDLLESKSRGIKELKLFHSFFKPEFLQKNGKDNEKLNRLKEIFLNEKDNRTFAVYIYHFKKEDFIEKFQIDSFIKTLKATSKLKIKSTQGVEYHLNKFDKDVENETFYFNSINKIKEYAIN